MKQKIEGGLVEIKRWHCQECGYANSPLWNTCTHCQIDRDFNEEIEGELYELATCCRQDDRNTYESGEQIRKIQELIKLSQSQVKASERQRCVEALPKKKKHNFDYNNQSVSRYRAGADMWGDEYASEVMKKVDAFNLAIDQAKHNLEQLK